jgi:hypothetical protein
VTNATVGIPASTVPTRRRTRRATLKRLYRVNRALSAWDEQEAAPARPDLFPVLVPPTMTRVALKSLQQELVTAIADQAAF